MNTESCGPTQEGLERRLALLFTMKGKRKRMRKAIREAMNDPRPWLNVVESLEAKGIPLNLILKEANHYGIQRQKKQCQRNT